MKYGKESGKSTRSGKKKDGYHLMIKANILRILTMLIRAYQDESKSGEMLKEKKNSMKRLEQAFRYINSHFCEKITLEEAAGAAFMSPSYFSTYFRKVTNISFSEYVTRLRISHARELLKTQTGVLPISPWNAALTTSLIFTAYISVTPDALPEDS